jgi:hypothetical protein
VGGLVVAVSIPAIALAWWLGSPLFLDKEVNEDFPRAAAASLPSGVTAAEAEKAMMDAEVLTVEMSEDMSMEGVVAVRGGTFRDADSFHKGSGSATVYRLDDGGHLLRLEDFRVTNGPDLHVYLSAASNPTSSPDVREGGYLDLGSLKGNVGNQNYEIPAGTDITQYRSVVIYCEPFHVVFSVASLE